METNFCAHALDQFQIAIKKFSPPSLVDSSPKNDTQWQVEELALNIQDLKSSIKFRLPIDGWLTDWEGKDLKIAFRDYATPFRMPYPVMCLEFAGSDGQRFILICTEHDPDDETKRIVADQRRFGISIRPLLWDKREKLWFSPGHTVYINSPDDSCDEFRFWARTNPGYREPTEEETEYLTGLTGFISTCIGQFVAALGCKNVCISEDTPSQALNKKRSKKGKQPFFTYHVLEIEAFVSRYPHVDLGGTHASPRCHLRRGHFRQHPTAGRIWVNKAVVGNKKLGFVHKDYLIVHEAHLTVQ